jgi:flagellar basal-body rod modification protein FlgD
MTISAVTTATPASTAAGTTKSGSNGDISSTFGLGRDDFFKLFLSQLANQDPMNPVDDKAFIDQLAQFTMIDTLTSVKTALSGTQLAQASSLLGKEIQGMDASGKAITGVVDRVLQANGKLMLKIGDNTVSPDNVSSVTDVPNVPAATIVPVATTTTASTATSAAAESGSTAAANPPA